MGDEGAGIQFVNQLNQSDFSKPITILDGGTSGFHLMSYFENYNPIILVDACLDGKPPGTINLIKPKFAADFPKALSSHDIGLKDVIEALILRNTMPDIYLFTVSIAEIQPMQINLSPAIQQSLVTLQQQVNNLIQTL
jgi:hydrogenase maturation protease